MPVIAGSGGGAALTVLLLVLLIAVCIKRAHRRRKRDQVEVRVVYAHVIIVCTIHVIAFCIQLEHPYGRRRWSRTRE